MVDKRAAQKFAHRLKRNKVRFMKREMDKKKRSANGEYINPSSHRRQLRSQR